MRTPRPVVAVWMVPFGELAGYSEKQAPVTFRPVAAAGRIEATESLQIQVGVARIEVRPGFEPGRLLFPDVCAYSFRVRQNLMKGMKSLFYWLRKQTMNTGR